MDIIYSSGHMEYAKDIVFFEGMAISSECAIIGFTIKLEIFCSAFNISDL
jgi:hypothetical protein